MQNGIVPMFSLGSSSILEWGKIQPIGKLYSAYTQFASDSPTAGTDASFVLLNKAGEEYLFFYGFAYNHIYYANANSSTSFLDWEKII